MITKLDSYIIELESKIQILERENETLSAKAEENLLLNRAFEEINLYDDIEHLLLNTLESISVLLSIQFSGIFSLNNDHFSCRCSYALFSNEDTTDIQLELPENLIDKLKSFETCLLKGNDTGVALIYPNTSFSAHTIAIVPAESEILKNQFFVFANDTDEQDLSDRKALFEKIARIISTNLDKIYYQNELIQLNEKLEQKIESRTIDLINQNNVFATLNEQYKKINEELLISKEKAEESDRLKTAFLQNMSHEIRTPMNSIMGFASLLSDNYQNKSKLQQFSKIINQRCNDLLDIINDILDIAKIESGQLHVSYEDCNLPELFSELKSFFAEHQTRIGKQHVGFNMICTCESTDRKIQTDTVKLKQILINLIVNAFKFTETGSIECSCTHDDKELVFSVSDTGIGIPTDKHEQIFERFTQLHPMGSNNMGGTGLGLSIAKALTGLLGGNIWLESEPGKGSVFYFSIPYHISQAPLKETNISPKEEKIHFNNKKILIVEDDLYNAEYLKEALSDYGFEISVTGYGKEAIQIASSQVMDLVLMDIRLPDLNGYEAVKKIKELKPHIKIIAQTAYAAQEEKQKALDAGCVDYISKPIKRDILIQLIGKHIS